ncbi:hypothetical protein PGT21_031033 [Puccinia graminis f. sp. tritici]|uniref:Uncharacterized protein n=1 Tax=Puccinia graminis f. sp. tritici TaxID=56615 RepID=A0A5B0QU55_PUCGR|nr:hypothetical protein PGT21_031033 [Puccinia graminis f. sp. tritici]KAA1116812.1 hypothetical protein PGTUg99_021819 [Puccinia graminis f. sp. tritici]
MFSAKQLITALTLALLSVHLVESMKSQCGQWAMQKLSSSSDSDKVVVAKLMSAKNERAFLQRRNDPPGHKGKTVSGGSTSACGGKAYSDNQQGSCLWNGANQDSSPRQGLYRGWLNGANTNNCFKTLWINGAGPLPKYAPVLDGCPFEDYNIKPEVGCATIWVTKATLKALGGKDGDTEVPIKNWGFSADTPAE